MPDQPKAAKRPGQAESSRKMACQGLLSELASAWRDIVPDDSALPGWAGMALGVGVAWCRTCYVGGIFSLARPSPEAPSI